VTREEIERMEPGKKLDRLVTEKVFGKEVKPGHFCRRYSTDIAAAWEGVEAIKRELQDVTIHDDPYQCVTVSISLLVVARDITAPLAICKAALLAQL